METQGKSRAEVLAEREARKKAKLAKKKPKQNPPSNDSSAKSSENSAEMIIHPARCTVTDGCARETPEKSAPMNCEVKSSKSGRITVTDGGVQRLSTSGIMKEITSDNTLIKDLVDGCMQPVQRNFQPLSENILALSKDMECKASITKPKSIVANQNKSLPKSEDLSSAEPVKSKAELKAERRAKQEAQRAAKAAKVSTPKTASKPTEMKPAKSAIKQNSSEPKPQVKSKSVTFANLSTKQASQHKIKLFSHLYKEKSINYKLILNSNDLHPAVVGLGVQYSSRVIAGSNARCVALMHVLKKMLSDYKTPAEKEFSRGFEAKLEPAINYLNQCRPISVSMTNALKHIKWHLTQLPNNITDAEARLKMTSVITTYIKEQIEVAGEAISLFVRKKIANGDVILTYGCSSLVERILKDAQQAGVDFSVVVVDNGPWFEGKELLRRLFNAKIPCTYVLISAASFIMKQASKVLLGAHALLANGCVMSRSGTALVAMLANTVNVPVLVCCETHKFSERVQTDAFVYNELGDPNELVSNTSPLLDWETNNFLVPLSLVYDVTPPDLVTAVVTELAILPCTSVPVVLRVKPTESSI